MAPPDSAVAAHDAQHEVQHARPGSPVHAPASGRRPIRELSPDMIDKIAAGEVVERPSSVVKELVENSIDAGARRIEVALEEGGRQLIRIVDDGWGIPRDELVLAVKSHATSKLSAPDDLFAIRTLGFRGEALASVASVSNFRIASCPRGSSEGAELMTELGREPRTCAHPPGTTVEVRSLFFNVPARRAFLRTPRAELQACEQEVLRLALGSFGVDIALEHEGRRVLRATPTDEPRERIAELFSRELAENLLAVGPRTSSAGRIRGYASPLDRSRGDARQQLFFLNGRAVRDRVFLGAVRDAYAHLLPPRRHPSVLLWLDVPPDEVDVNVHPTKAEVRFRRASDVFALIVSTLREAIVRAGAPAPPLSFPKRLGLVSPLSPGEPAPASSGAAPGPVGSIAGLGTAASDGTPPAPTSTAEPTEPGAPRAPAPLELPFGGSSAPAPLDRGAFFQMHRRYIVEETPRGFRLVDPHALHERLLYDEILARLTSGPLESQRLLFPVVVEVDRQERSEFEERRPLLEAMGFEIAPFGPGSLGLHAAPRIVPPGSLPELLRELLSELRARDVPQQDDALDAAASAMGSQQPTSMGAVAARRLVHGVAAALACKAAVKFGASLGRAEIEALLARREEARAACCPHGRPTALSITLEELNKRFGRS